MRTLKRVLLWSGLAILFAVVYLAAKNPGSLTLGYAESPSRHHQELREYLAAWGGFEQTVEALNQSLLLPRDLRIVFQDCGQANAFYFADSTAVVFCYELLSDLAGFYRLTPGPDSVRSAAVLRTAYFVLYHELGHALVDLHSLPITGREEDVVDQLATLTLLNGGPEGRDAALQGAIWFARKSEAGAGAFWDEHSLDPQRYYNIICWVYGSAPEAHQALLQNPWALPRPRAERCPAEYQRMRAAWDKLLKPHTI